MFSEADKLCWLLDAEPPVSSQLTKLVINLRQLVQTELGKTENSYLKLIFHAVSVSAPLKNGNIKEIEFEFESKIEVTYHFEGLDVICISKQ